MIADVDGSNHLLLQMLYLHTDQHKVAFLLTTDYASKERAIAWPEEVSMYIHHKLYQQRF